MRQITARVGKTRCHQAAGRAENLKFIVRTTRLTAVATTLKATLTSTVSQTDSLPIRAKAIRIPPTVAARPPTNGIVQPPQRTIGFLSSVLMFLARRGRTSERSQTGIDRCGEAVVHPVRQSVPVA